MNWWKRQKKNITAWDIHALYAFLFLSILPAILKFFKNKTVLKVFGFGSVIFIPIGFEIGQNNLTNIDSITYWLNYRVVDSVGDCLVAYIGAFVGYILILSIVKNLKGKK